MVYRDRKTIRLNGYDYSLPGYYFITICTHNHENLFGTIAAQQNPVDCAAVELNGPGVMVDDVYNNMENEFTNVVLHEHIVMPNHLHGIIQILNANRADMESAPTLSRIIQTFKRITTIKYTEGVRNKSFEPFEYKVWQRSYYDHIIRNESELMQIRKYIISNPAKWSYDEYHPSALTL